MKKVFYLIYLILLFLAACTDQNTVYEQHQDFSFTNNKITLNKQADSLLQLFINESHYKESDYYMILYHGCGEHIITFIENNIGNNYYLKKYAVISYWKNEKMVNLIVGDFMEIETIKQKKINPEMENSTPFYRIRSYVIQNGIIRVISKGIPPFAPPPSAVQGEP